VQSLRTQVEEFTHELGHDLGLHHGGGDDDDHCYLPNRWSVMSYTWDKRAGFSDVFRLAHATCTPFYYGQAGAVSGPAGQLPMMAGITTDFSSGMGKPLVRPGSGGTPVLMCGKVVDWAHDSDGNINECFGVANTGTITDVADWPMLKYDGPARNGSLVP
jgi:hypothetical protein